RLTRTLTSHRMLSALIERHHNVGAQCDLDLHRALRSKEVTRTVQSRAELRSRLRNFAQLGQAEDLNATGISKNAVLPRHEAMQPAHLANSFVPRPKIQVVSVT